MWRDDEELIDYLDSRKMKKNLSLALLDSKLPTYISLKSNFPSLYGSLSYLSTYGFSGGWNDNFYIWAK